MKTFRAAVFTPLVFLLWTAIANAQPELKLLRLAVVDNSGSMRGERITVVRQELQKLLRQLPPSTEYPFVLVTFDSSAQQAQSYSTLKEAVQAIDRLDGNGNGTRIAAGLAEASRMLSLHATVPNTWVLLYTDGGDGDKQSILREEAKLDALFGQRQQNGLQQTVVFCKRWGNSNAFLRQQIERRGRAQVVDAGEAQLAPLTLDPQVAVTSVRWTSATSSVVEIKFVPLVRIGGRDDKLSLSPLRFLCRNSEADGDTQFEIPPGTGPPPPSDRTIRFPVAPAQQRAGQTRLMFSVEQPAPQPSAKGLLLPLLPATTLDIPVSLPLRQHRCQLSAECELAAAPRWTNPFSQTAAFSLRLKLRVESDWSGPGDHLCRLSILPGAATSILEGQTTVVIPRPGEYAIPLTVELKPRHSSALSQDVRYHLTLDLRPIDPSPNIVFVPPRLDINLQKLAPPPPVTTTITAKVMQLSPPVWSDLDRGVAALQAQVRFRVDGPLPPGSQVVLIAAPGVTALSFAPAQLHTGEQLVTVRVAAIVSTKRPTDEIALRIVPPQPQGAVSIRIAGLLTIPVTSPPPLQLVSLSGGRALPALTASAGDTDTYVDLPIHPAVIGAVDIGIARRLQARLSSPDDRLRLARAEPLPLFREQTVRVPLPQNRDAPFFRDAVVSGVFDLQPCVQTPAVQGSRYPVQITIRAPFKRLTFYLAVCLSPVATLLILLRMWSRLRSTE